MTDLEERVSRQEGARMREEGCYYHRDDLRYCNCDECMMVEWEYVKTDSFHNGHSQLYKGKDEWLMYVDEPRSPTNPFRDARSLRMFHHKNRSESVENGRGMKRYGEPTYEEKRARIDASAKKHGTAYYNWDCW